MTGRFLWYELLSTDPRAAIAFYQELIGWKTELFPSSEGKEPYTMWVSAQGPLGGVTVLPNEAKRLGAKSQWMSYVGVDEIEETVAEVKKLGGVVRVPPTVIPQVGRFSVISEQVQSASIALLQPDPREGQMLPHDGTKHGEISWRELYSQDAKASLEFYGKLFGWQLMSEVDMGSSGKYLIYGQGDQQYGGMMTISPTMQITPSWIYYIQVDELDASIVRATERGAKVLMGPMTVPDGSRIAQLLDAEGVMFALNGA